MRNTLVIGLTGGVGSGKSRILDILTEEYGAQVLQTDQVAKQLQTPGMAGYEALVSCFGQSIVGEDGNLKKEALTRLLFGDNEARSQINGLIHPLVWNEVTQWVRDGRQKGLPLLVVESAILPENSGDFFDEIWYVYTLKEERIRRLADSRGYSRERSLWMMEVQPSEEEYRGSAAYVIDNNGSLEWVKEQITLRLG